MRTSNAFMLTPSAGMREQLRRASAARRHRPRPHDVHPVELAALTRPLTDAVREARMLRKRSPVRRFLLVTSRIRLRHRGSISDRILVKYDGAISSEVGPRTTGREAIGLMMVGAGPRPGRKNVTRPDEYGR